MKGITQLAALSAALFSGLASAQEVAQPGAVLIEVVDAAQKPNCSGKAVVQGNAADGQSWSWAAGATMQGRVWTLPAVEPGTMMVRIDFECRRPVEGVQSADAVAISSVYRGISKVGERVQAFAVEGEIPGRRLAVFITALPATISPTE